MYKRAQKGIGYLAQEASVFRKMSIEENILSVLQMTRLKKSQQIEKMESLITEFGLEHIRKNRGDLLSGGERNRLALAKLLLQPFNVLVMDEPTNHLDIKSKNVLKQALIKFNGTLILVSHDRDFLQQLTNKVYEFKNQKIKEYLGDIDYYLDQRQVENFREIEKKEKKIVAKSNKAPSNSNERNLKKKISNVESKISRLEKEISIIDNNLLNNYEKESVLCFDWF